jgi:hypothetical protein
LFAVTDFEVGEIDVDLGIGYGLTSGSANALFPEVTEDK